MWWNMIMFTYIWWCRSLLLPFLPWTSYCVFPIWILLQWTIFILQALSYSKCCLNDHPHWSLIYMSDTYSEKEDHPRRSYNPRTWNPSVSCAHEELCVVQSYKTRKRSVSTTFEVHPCPLFRGYSQWQEILEIPEVSYGCPMYIYISEYPRISFCLHFQMFISLIGFMDSAQIVNKTIGSLPMPLHSVPKNSTLASSSVASSKDAVLFDLPLSRDGNVVFILEATV